MKRLCLLFLFFFSVAFYGQTNQMWGSYFSYNNIVDISDSPSRVYAASESAIFYQNVLTGELKTITSVDGLKAETITAVHHSSDFNRTLIGNSNGLLIIVKQDNSVVIKQDILQEATIAPNIKRINSIDEHDGIAYISCDFGIAVFNLATMEFGDSYYIGANGDKIKVYQTAVWNDRIYAATDTYGIRSANINSPNLIDYSEWSELVSGLWQGIVNHEGNLIAITGNVMQYYSVPNSTFYFLAVSTSNYKKLKSSNGYLTGTSATDVFVYNDILQQAAHITAIPDNAEGFSASTVINERVYIGTAGNGVYATFLDNQMVYDNITPDGPLRSNIFSLTKTNSYLWACFGGYKSTYEPDYATYGVSKLTGLGWVNIPYSELFEARSISHITVNPAAQNTTYLNSYHSGLVKVENDEPEILYNNTNTGANGLKSATDPANPSFVSVRVNGGTFFEGDLWMTNGRVPKPLVVLRSGGQWASYDFDELFDDPGQVEYDKMVIDRNGTKWIPTNIKGVVAFNEKMNNKILAINESTGNLPGKNATCVAIDNNNRLWIGTDRGLRVMSSVERFRDDDQLVSNPIIIMEDGLAQELMYNQSITDIEVDGSNNKWIGTIAGAFLVSPDGQETIYYFTKDNSPLPSNVINDIEIDPTTGEVFFATDKGMVSYKGTSTAAEGDLNNVYIYPNPVRPGFNDDVKISGLMDNVNLKITDIEGNLVYETTSEGGTVLWDTKAFGRYKVASGVYMVFIASDDGTKTKVKKIMIIR